jgi:hypothetical protein
VEVLWENTRAASVSQTTISWTATPPLASHEGGGEANKAVATGSQVVAGANRVVATVAGLARGMDYTFRVTTVDPNTGKAFESSSVVVKAGQQLLNDVTASAEFSADRGGGEIMVSFPAPTNRAGMEGPMAAPCSDMLDAASVALVGAGAVCQWGVSLLTAPRQSCLETGWSSRARGSRCPTPPTMAGGRVLTLPPVWP